MPEADAATSHTPVQSQTGLRTLLLIAAAILGAWLVFVFMAPPALAPFFRATRDPALATAAPRSYPIVVIATGVLHAGSGSNLVLVAPFSQAEDVQLDAGQVATVTLDSIPGLSLPAEVISIETSATPVGGVPEYYAEVTLSATDPRLREGDTGSVKVTVASANNVLSVPSTALFVGANNQMLVDVWSSGHAHATSVTVGLVGTNLTQIASGLQAGDQVVLSPAGQLPSSPSPS
jgi:multidrug efflux pump subunit AcrA (membrane-fusion protein)